MAADQFHTLGRGTKYKDLVTTCRKDRVIDVSIIHFRGNRPGVRHGIAS